MLFMFLATDAENTGEARATARPAHLERLEALHRENRLLCAGPNPLPDNPSVMSGSLIVADFRQPDCCRLPRFRRRRSMGRRRPLCARRRVCRNADSPL